MTDATRVWTIGHSNGSAEHLVELLGAVPIDAVVDVRSQPYSRFNPQFNREPLRATLGDAGLRYLHLGHTLGGRPPDPSVYDDDGRVRYAAVAASEAFAAGIDRLVDGAAHYRVAIMCSEEDPYRCHRRLLITPVLLDRQVEVIHLRGDGTAVAETDLAVAERDEPPTLFGDPPR